MTENSPAVSTPGIQGAWNWIINHIIDIWATGNIAFGGLAVLLLPADTYKLLDGFSFQMAPNMQLSVQRGAFGTALMCVISQIFYFWKEKKSKASRTQVAKMFEEFRVNALGEMEDLRAKCGRLESDNERWAAQVDKMVEGHLIQLAKNHLEFGERDCVDERVTLYVYDPNGYFVPKGRYSPNSELAKIKRRQFAVGEGCIGLAWATGVFFANDLPDPKADAKGYKDASAKYGLKKRQVNKLSMKARLYFGLRISDLSKVNNLAVLVVEASDPSRYTKEELVEKLSGRDGRYLSHLAEHLVASAPKVSDAAKEGF